MPATHDLAKAPQWIKDEISRRDREIATLREALAAGPEDSDTFVENFATTPIARTPLGRQAHVVFTLGNGAEVRVTNQRTHVDIGVEGGPIGSTMSVQPRYSNKILVATVPSLDR